MFVFAAKIFSLLLATIAISKSYVDFRGRRESLQMFLFWSATWVVIVTVALFPSIIDALIHFFGDSRTGLGTFFGMALVFLFFVVYRIYAKLENIEHKLTKTIREMALREDWNRKK